MSLDVLVTEAERDRHLRAALPGLHSLLTPEERRATTAPVPPGRGLRRMSNDEMLARVTPHLRDYGITRIANLSYIDRLGLPVHTAYKPNGLSLASGSGKGVTQGDSALGAAMEAIEQSVWEDLDPAVIRLAQRDLERECVPFADGGLLARVAGNLWHPGLVIDWTPMVDLMTGEQVWVPADLVTVPARREPAIARSLAAFMPGSNGLASGHDVAEALMSALFEVLERDAITMGPLTIRTAAPDVDALAADVGGDVAWLTEVIQSHKMSLRISDVTTDAGIPTYAAQLYDLMEPKSGVFGGYGNGFDVHRALVRAITEAVQSRGVIIAGARDDIFATSRRAATRISNHQAPPPPGGAAPIVHRALHAPDVCTALQLLAEAAARSGCPQVLVSRHSNPGDPAQVVRVVVPGLEGYHFSNYSPGPRARAAVVASSS
jgi:YcaO-like protein with predicted kinase domain